MGSRMALVRRVYQSSINLGAGYALSLSIRYTSGWTGGCFRFPWLCLVIFNFKLPGQQPALTGPQKCPEGVCAVEPFDMRAAGGSGESYGAPCIELTQDHV